MTERRLGSRPPLARLLFLASRWFDEQSRSELERRGWPKLTSAQTALFAHLSEAPVSPAELARRLGNSRQATADLVQGLVRHGLLDVADDPARGNGRLVSVTARGLQLATEAYEFLLQLESQLDDTVVDKLRSLLADLGLAR